MRDTNDDRGRGRRRPICPWSAVRVRRKGRRHASPPSWRGSHAASKAAHDLRSPWPTARGLRAALSADAYRPYEAAGLHSRLRCDGAADEDRGIAVGAGPVVVLAAVKVDKPGWRDDAMCPGVSGGFERGRRSGMRPSFHLLILVRKCIYRDSLIRVHTDHLLLRLGVVSGLVFSALFLSIYCGMAPKYCRLFMYAADVDISPFRL
jgi:hypothetical protein